MCVVLASVSYSNREPQSNLNHYFRYQATHTGLGCFEEYGADDVAFDEDGKGGAADHSEVTPTHPTPHTRRTRTQAHTHKYLHTWGFKHPGPSPLETYDPPSRR